MTDTDGEVIPLGEVLGVGGEGRVFEVVGVPGVAAKIYHKMPLDQSQVEKFQAMLKIGAKDLAPIAAWPQKLLLDARNDKPCGILMTRIHGALELHELYGASTRSRHFPHAYWHHLVLAARNVAAAFDAMHTRGVVVGDVNQGNLLVDAEMCVRFIDCDSFQITDNGQVFPCLVGTPHFTPPELQSMRLGEVVRDPQQDVFGMAQLLFHLLFVGRHPFAGRFRGKGDLPIERAIAERRFAFSRHRDQTLVDPPPASLSLNDLPPRMAEMFELAFRCDTSRDQQRPQAREWVLELERLLKGRRECGIDSSHVYSGTTVECPWCRIEVNGGPSFFVNSALVGGSMQSRLEAYDRCVAQVEQITFPDLSRKALQVPRLPPLKKREKGLPYRRADWAALGPPIGGAVAVGGLFYWPLLVAGTVVSVASGLGLLLGRGGKSRRQVTLEYEEKLDASTDRVVAAANEVLARQHRRETEFDTYAAVVQTGKDRYSADAEDLETVIKQLRVEQREDYLKSLEIRQHRRKIPGLQRGHVASLQSYGVETADECESHLLAGIPNVPPEIVIELTHWRERLLQQFSFRPEAGITEKEAEIDRQEASARFKISQARKVLNGATRLRAMSHEGRRALKQELASFENIADSHRALAREFQDYQEMRSQLERKLNANHWTVIAAMLAPPVLATLLWLLFG